jgi:hypothetical protein
MADPFRISSNYVAGPGYNCVFPRYIYRVTNTAHLHDKEIYYIINNGFAKGKCKQIDYYNNEDNEQPYKNSRIGTVVMHDKGKFYEIDDSDRNSDIKTHIGSFTTPKKKEDIEGIDTATIFATYYVYSKREPQTVQGGKKSRKQRKSRKQKKSRKSRKSRK